ncbi:unnamed protein product [Phytophthora lilii]|uniref:Unnamed protein product n=1 Tax=Phytophthora lilii TaxID=2077276 RepID=A0A9W6XIH1_9STRA|nr:unnamed protein product [Phytophthora lilii]
MMKEKTMIGDKWAAVQESKRNGWSVGQATRELKVQRPNLLRKKLYWNYEEPTAETADRFRAPGVGRPHRLASFELDALRYYENLREHGEVSSRDIRVYCNMFSKFRRFPMRSQQSWVRQFIKRYSRDTKVASQQDATAPESGSQSDEGADTADAPAAAQQEAPAAQQEGQAQESASQSHEGPADSPESVKDKRPEHAALAVQCGSDSSDGVASPSTTGTYGLRQRLNPFVPVVAATPAPWSTGITVPQLGDDLASVKPGYMLTASVVDYCVTTFVQPGLAFPTVSSVFSEIYAGYSSPLWSGQAPETSVPWNDYKFFLCPVVKDDHWSFVVIESASKNASVFYHIDSFTRVPSPTTA